VLNSEFDKGRPVERRIRSERLRYILILGRARSGAMKKKPAFGWQI
jgi:hypothetical protein